MLKVTSSFDREYQIPATITAGQLAQVLGVTERTVAGRKSDGRLPVAANGRIDLAAIIRAGVVALSGRPLPDAADLAESFEDGLRVAAHAATRLMLTRFQAAEPGADLGAVAAGALREALELFGVAEAAEAPIPDRLEPLTAVAREGAAWGGEVAR